MSNFFYTAGEKPDDPAVEQLGNFPLVDIMKYILLQQWYINQPGNEVGTWFFNQWRLAAHIKRHSGSCLQQHQQEGRNCSIFCETQAV
jgi:hypothetical protein